MLRLRVLDEVTWDGVAVSGDKPRALLRLLAEVGPRGLSADALADELWPDDPPEHPAKALQVVVSRTRSATCAELIERTERGYRLALSETEVDLWASRPEGLRLAAEGRWAEALPLLSNAGNDDEVVEARLRGLAATRGVPAALEHYEDYREHVSGLLGVDPSPRLRALHAELLASDRPIREGLRHEAESLVGRVDELAELRALVRRHRLVTILGAGGLGKTRLAHLIGQQAEQPVVHFIELVTVTDDGKVALEIADSLGARDANTTRRASTHTADRDDPVQRIIGLIGDLPTLLILDNCEQVASGVAGVVQTLLAHLPRLTVLTTSRSPLDLTAEQVFALPELSTDDAETLFRQRARAGRPGVVLDPDAVARIVARLDGLPLAIELAAARTRMLSLGEIERRLDDRFALLRAESRDLPDRHRTLLAVIDWSWQLLSADEQEALRRLAVCRADVGLDAAAAIAGVAADEVLELLRSLVNQSLVVLVETEGEVRFRLLEMVREFGSQRLAQSGEEEATWARFVTWALAFSIAAADDLFSEDHQIDAVRRVRREEGPLMDVLRHATAARDADAIAATAGLLSGFWSIEGAHLKFSEIGMPAAVVVSELTVSEEYLDAARALLSMAVIMGRVFQGTAPDGLVSCLRAWGTEGAPGHLAGLITVVLTFVAEDPAEAMAGLEVLTGDEDTHVARFAAVWLSQFYENQGRLDEAWEVSFAAWRRFDSDGDPWHVAMLDAHLAQLALSRGEFTQARRFAEAALPVMSALGAKDDWTQLQYALAVVAIKEGDIAEAERLVAELDNSDPSPDDILSLFSRMCVHGELLLAQGRTEEGLQTYRATVATLAERWVGDAAFPVAFEPWLLLPASAALMAHLRAEVEGWSSSEASVEVKALHDTVEQRAARMLAGNEQEIDNPVLGAAQVALGCWELLRGGTARGQELVDSGLHRSPSQLLPSVDLSWARSLLV